MKHTFVAMFTAAATVLVGIVAPAQAAVTTPTTADGFTRMFAAKNDQTWSGGDQMTSFQSPRGYVYWLSADTVLSNGVTASGGYPSTGTTMVSNHILLQQGNQLVNAMANGGLGIPDPATHTAANAERYWPQSMFYANGHLYVLAQHVINDATQSLGFGFLGVDIATYSVASNGTLTFTGLKPTPSSNTRNGIGPARIQWVDDAVVTGGYVYVYGTTQPPSNPSVLHYSYVARVPASLVTMPSAWRYYRKSAKQWVTSTNQLSTDLLNEPDAILPTEISSVRIINGYTYIIHKPWNGLGSAVYIEKSRYPQGPFTETKIFDSPAGTVGATNYVTYAPMLHPEQTLGGPDAGKLLVSIDWNGATLTDLVNNAQVYKPRFYAVPLP